jgi:hypothetical protein
VRKLRNDTVLQVHKLGDGEMFVTPRGTFVSKTSDGNMLSPGMCQYLLTKKPSAQDLQAQKQGKKIYEGELGIMILCEEAGALTKDQVDRAFLRYMQAYESVRPQPIEESIVPVFNLIGTPMHTLTVTPRGRVIADTGEIGSCAVYLESIPVLVDRNIQYLQNKDSLIQHGEITLEQGQAIIRSTLYNVDTFWNVAIQCDRFGKAGTSSEQQGVLKALKSLDAEGEIIARKYFPDFH